MCLNLLKVNKERRNGKKAETFLLLSILQYVDISADSLSFWLEHLLASRSSSE